MKRIISMVLLFTVCLAIGFAGGPEVCTPDALSGANNLSDVGSTAVALTNLGGATSASLTAHEVGNSDVHGCSVVASAAAVALKADLAGSSGQAFAADEVQADTLRSAAGASTAITLTAAGGVAFPRQPSFRVYKSAETMINTASATVATFTSEGYDTRDSIVPSNGVFTAPEAGVYLFYAYGRWAGNATGYRNLAFRVNGSGIAVARSNPVATEYTYFIHSFVYQLSAGHTVDVVLTQTSGGGLEYDLSFIGVKIN